MRSIGTVNRRFKFTTCGVLSVLAVNLAWLSPAAARSTASETQEQFQRDRQSILSMAGTYHVTFDMRETVPFVAGYQPIPSKVSSGNEMVKVIEDSGTVINLQHLLIVAGDEGAITVVKHWRQSWVYEPKELLVYAGAGRWNLKPLSSAERAGQWSQTVWQTDDSPRYGGVGRWLYDGGVARWDGGLTLRPLARRDAVRHPVYDRYLGTNRHALTPAGWVHEQDNAKLGIRDGQTLTFVHEVVINTYSRASDFDTAAADRYWEATQEYWAAVRKTWDSAIHSHLGIDVQEEAENGSITGPALMKLGSRIADGGVDTAAAVAEANAEIAKVADSTATRGSYVGNVRR